MTLLVLTAFSCIGQSDYPKIEYRDPDTVIVYSLDQARELTRIDIENEQLKHERDLFILKIEHLQKVVSVQDSTIEICDARIINLKNINKARIEKENLLQENIDSSQKEIKRQKRRKIAWMSGSIILTVIAILK